MIEVKHVTKTYGKKQNAFRALDDVNFEIPDGASVAWVEAAERSHTVDVSSL